MERRLRLALLASFVVVALVVTLAWGLVVADRIGSSRTICSVVAFEAPGAEGAVEIPAELDAEHPEWGRAMIQAAPSRGGVETFDCARYDAMRADLDALDAPPGPEHGALVSRDGKPYDLSVGRGVA